MTLHELGLKHNTDKATYHGFCKIYDNIFKDLRNKDIRFLEIGIASGSSLKMWSDYFELAEINGADILDRKYLDDIRIKTYQINQEVDEELNLIPGEFHIIVEDGGHTMFQQQITLKNMMRKLKSGGFYILEDLHTSLLNFAEHGYGCTELNNTLRLLNDLQQKKMTGEYFINLEDFNSLLDMIDSIEIFVTDSGSVTSCITKI
jgi:hypothetical protein